MKDDLPYFSHDNDARNHPKMKALRARFGWAGYGQFWALNEMIAGASGARLDLSRKVVRSATACELGMTTDALDDFLTFLSDRDECGLIHYENGIVTTDRTTEDYEKTEAGRESSRERYNRKKSTFTEKAETSHEKSETSPEKRYRIEENRIEKNRIEREEGACAPVCSPKKFKKPTQEEVAAYCAERGNSIDAQSFLDFYESKGWKVGQTPMKDWRAAVRTWEKRDYGNSRSPPVQTPEIHKIATSCPVCGANVVGTSASCSSCGFTISDKDDQDKIAEHSEWFEGWKKERRA